MYPNMPRISRVIVLMALQAKPHIYDGTALPKDPKRRARRVKAQRRNADRLRMHELADHAEEVGFVAPLTDDDSEAL